MLSRTLLVLSASAGLSSLMAQEIASGVFLNGWSNNVLTWAHDPSLTEGGGSLGAENYDSLDFSTAAKLMVDWTVNTQVSGRMSIRFNDVGGDNVAEQDGAYLTESWVMIQANEKTSVTMGKFTNPFGWQGPDPTDLNRVGYGLTVAYYGDNDPLGVSVVYVAGNLIGCLQVTNGFFLPIDGTNAGSVNSNDPAVNEHKRHDLGLAADFTLKPDEGDNFANLEFAWDPSSSTNAGGGFKGNVFQTSVNGSYYPAEKLLLGGEIIYRSSQNSVVTDDGSLAAQQDIAWMATATRTLNTDEKLFPMAATVMFSADNQDFVGDSDASIPVDNQIAVALLSNPYGSINFGLNLEYQYQWAEGTNSNQNTNQIALEGLIVIP